MQLLWADSWYICTKAINAINAKSSIRGKWIPLSYLGLGGFRCLYVLLKRYGPPETLGNGSTKKRTKLFRLGCDSKQFFHSEKLSFVFNSETVFFCFQVAQWSTSFKTFLFRLYQIKKKFWYFSRKWWITFILFKLTFHEEFTLKSIVLCKL